MTLIIKIKAPDGSVAETKEINGLALKWWTCSNILHIENCESHVFSVNCEVLHSVEETKYVKTLKGKDEYKTLKDALDYIVGNTDDPEPDLDGILRAARKALEGVKS